MRYALGRVWLTATALCCGTAVGSVVPVRVATTICALGVVALCFRRRATAAVVGIVFLAAGVGMLNAGARLAARGPLTELAHLVPRCSVEGTVIEHIGGLGSLASLDHADCGVWEGTSLGVVAIDDPVLEPGASFAVQGWVVPLDNETFGDGRRRLGAQAELHVISLRGTKSPHGLHATAARFREGSRRSVAGIDPAIGALLQGLTIGETSEVTPAVVDDFRASGLSHVLAVSGSNVAIVLGAVLASMRSLGHKARIVAGFAALGMFALVVGPDASVLRAGLMGSIALACLARGRQAEPLAALGLAIIGVIGLRPGMLFSAGMHLSVAATAGIVLLSGPIGERLKMLPTAPRVMLAATWAAQIAVVPILALTFGEIPLLAPIANALALPAVGFATIVGLAAAPAAIVWPPAGRFLARAAAPAVAWIGFVAKSIGGVPGAVVHVPSVLGWMGLVALSVVVVLALRSAPARYGDRVTFRWVLHDSEGTDLRSSEDFESQADAEAWMGERWQSLLDEGAETVTLLEDDAKVYKMGLREA